MYIGDGAKLVRDAFELAKQKAPAIIFIDELDAIGTKRFDSDKSGDREVQRTMLELLNQLDGFSSDVRIKVRFMPIGFPIYKRWSASVLHSRNKPTETVFNARFIPRCLIPSDRQFW
jgi:AAA+ superfamily predicted ATPase